MLASFLEISGYSEGNMAQGDSFEYLNVWSNYPESTGHIICSRQMQTLCLGTIRMMRILLEHRLCREYIYHLLKQEKDNLYP